jgi:hypothetical protein
LSLLCINWKLEMVSDFILKSIFSRKNYFVFGFVIGNKISTNFCLFSVSIFLERDKRISVSFNSFSFHFLH